ncbi:ATP synthase F1 subunit gamma [Hydrogenimonas cancrithermarum]|uniref:ATP synthase gamma chain n=1 Tax=Hydrogenimonas cancrithermarum TaxID=2993563 RepID=A0ABN6WTL8_9BACT|nr:ATP synthase F1 subunit gamma [Hydrogenimonas cancrithermarum]BDY12341.1 ATP synthase gamma chain [Hydrogenimonas cancrithermarum]
MANLKEIKLQISSVKGTQKTTRAMKLVSQAKLKRAEELAKRSRVYAQKLDELVSEIAYEINQNKVGGSDSRFVQADLPVKTVDIICVTADKGLCGGFNVTTLKTTLKLIREYKDQRVAVRLRVVGRKAIDFLKYNGIEMVDEVIGLSASPDYKKAAEFIDVSLQDFAIGKTDRVVLIYNGFKNMLTQEQRVLQLLPVDISTIEERELKSSIEYEPEGHEELLNALLKKYVEYSMYYGLLDSLAAEHSARMQAMDNATKNASERVNELTVQYNKARQESITTELIEIISGVEALK